MKKVNGFLAGLVCGMVLCGTTPVAQAAVDWVQARLSPQEIYLDGEKVNWTVYNVADQNYVRLADLCPEIGVGLAWDSVTGYVLMNSDGTTPQVTQPTVTTPTVTTPSTSHGGVITIPQSDEKLDLKVGDKVLCDDGYEYEITNMDRYESNFFQGYNALPDLPSQQGDWSNLPTLPSLDIEVRHFSNALGDSLYITNMHETRRMQYTLYNLIANDKNAWEGTTPLATVTLGFDSHEGVPVMWPWDESQIVALFHSRPASDFTVSAFDYYKNGVYQQTMYYIQSW